jgi:hypothetical protein
MVGRAILWLALALGAVVVAVSLGFAAYMLGRAAVEGLMAVLLRTAVFKAAWDHPQSLMVLLLFTSGGLAIVWVIAPRLARVFRRGARRKASDEDDEPKPEESSARR